MSLTLLLSLLKIIFFAVSVDSLLYSKNDPIGFYQSMPMAKYSGRSLIWHVGDHVLSGYPFYRIKEPKYMYVLHIMYFIILETMQRKIWSSKLNLKIEYLLKTLVCMYINYICNTNAKLHKKYKRKSYVGHTYHAASVIQISSSKNMQVCSFRWIQQILYLDLMHQKSVVRRFSDFTFPKSGLLVIS